MTINVKFLPSYHDVTVRGGYWDDDYFVMDWCNHANSYSKTEHMDYMTFSGVDSHSYDVEVCDKCHGWFDDNNEEWVVDWENQ